MKIIGRITACMGASGAILLLTMNFALAAEKPHGDADHDGKAMQAKKPMSLSPAASPAKKKKPPAANTRHPRPAKKPVMKTASKKPASKPRRGPHWSYRGNAGPAQWGGLRKSYRACGAGQRQSPVNLEAVEPGRLQDLTFRYKVSLIRMINDGRTVRVNYGKGSHILLGGDRYDLVGFNFHTPSEHTVAGRSFPMEIQFKHRNKAGRIAMVGLLVTAGPASLAARELWDRLPAKAHTKSKDTRALINARDLLPDDTAHFRYQGSLTKPPCTENVTWLILRTPVSFSENQIARLRGIMGENARPVQARNGRYLMQSVGG